MIDTIYKTLLTLLNKENEAYISPTEFNLLANNVQQDIFRGYFDDYNKDKNRENRGLTNKGYANLSKNQRELIQQFAETSVNIGLTSDFFILPSNLYFIEEQGVLTGDNQVFPNRVIDEVERGRINMLRGSISKPTELYPVYEMYNKKIKVSPITITTVKVDYLRTPKFPNWTFFILPNNQPAYNPADPSFQDFELHPSEFSNIVIRMLSHFGITIRENEVIQVAEALKDKMNVKENN